jgi:hypothetical protein
MNEGPEAQREPAGYIRLPWPVVGAALFVVLAGLLAFGLFANRNLRPQAAAVPTASLSELPTPTSLAVVLPTRVNTPAALPTVAPTQTHAAVTQPSATAIAPPAATPRPTVSPELAAEVSSAYQQYWQVRAEALYELDDSRLQEVMAGDHLAAAEDLIRQLRSEGRAIRTDVTHKYVVLEATQNRAQIADEYTDDSIYVDMTSRQNLTEPVGALVKEQYQMDKIEGSWRVVSLVRST